ncbi:vitamin D 25-hydroxylase [Rhipicephalus sanguineus]|uniref:vitamin D 25-hydroxylase n=1 Tax=Rhipicephalus sanguineus TaxID=34632 RepID=UPI00189301D9|nr:vitamin D 25-hydroxylase [Rhipicephalus sanguineus]
MDEEASKDLPGAQQSRPAASRKRGNASSGTDSEATEFYSDSFDSSDDDFTVVMSRNAKRRLLRTSSSASVSTVKTTPQRWPHTMLFMAIDPAANLRLLNRQLVSEIEETYQEGTVRNFADGFISQMKNRQEANQTFTRKLLVGNVASFIGGGTGTMCTALEWLLVMSAAKPHQQNLVRAETDAVMESREPGSRITWSDRSKMPYTEAFTWETMRCKPVNPLALMRCTADDVKLGGYIVPRGSIIIPSFWSLFNEPSYWKDPEVFRPERFLSESGHLLTKPQWFIPFSAGKRSCPGESIANMVVFVYFTNILHHFIVEASTTGVQLNDEVLGITMRPKPWELVFRPRKLYR